MPPARDFLRADAPGLCARRPLNDRTTLPFNSPTAVARPARPALLPSRALGRMKRVHARLPTRHGRSCMGEPAQRRRQRYAENPDYREQIKAQGRAWRHANKEKINARERQRRATDPAYRARKQASDRRRNRARELKAHGLSLQQYAAMLRRQKGACAICKATGKLCVDHCHVTGVIGGLLCHKCNGGLGFFRDSPATMLDSATYLLQRRPQALSGAELARTRRALQRFIKVLDEAAAARRRR